MRLFIAVNIPTAEKELLGDLLEKLRQTGTPIRWVDPDSLHITMKFLGEVPADRVPEIHSALLRAAKRISAFEMRIGGFGVFPSATRARVFWIGVDAPSTLVDLQQSVERELSPLGFPTEKRPFQAHLTLGRVMKDERVAADDVDRMTRLAAYNSVVSVESADLMRSHLSPRGARYELLGRATLNKGD